MKIELSDQQEQQVKQGRTVEVVDPATQRTFVLLPREQYDQIRHLLEPGTKPEPADVSSEIAPGILTAQRAFWRDLPRLLETTKNHGQWVCYHLEERVGIGTYVDLLRECVRRNLPDDAFYLGVIEPHTLAPWEVEQVEPGGHEVEEVVLLAHSGKVGETQ